MKKKSSKLTVSHIISLLLIWGNAEEGMKRPGRLLSRA
jgi:hypothetical protein